MCECSECHGKGIVDHEKQSLDDRTAGNNARDACDWFKRGVSLNGKSESVRDRGQVLILKELHDEIDARVAEAYGWVPDLNEEQILDRLVALNAERSAGERRGVIQWLRTKYQVDAVGPLAHRADRAQMIEVGEARRVKRLFPQDGKAQAGEIIELFSRSKRPLTAVQIASQFRDHERVAHDVEDVLRSLTRLGEAETFDEDRSYVRVS